MYPIMMNLKHKKIVVIGGGKVASRKITALLKEEAEVTVISTSLHPEIMAEKVNWQQKKYEADDLTGAALIFACTNDDAVNEQVLADASSAQWVNVTSNKYVSEFFNVATAKVNGLSVSVSTEGVSPMRAKKIREQLEGYLKELEA